MQSSNQNILAQVSEVTWELLVKEPFYGHFFTGLIKKVSTEIDTLAVGADRNLVIFYINEVFWTERLSSPDYKMGGIKHEILHIVLEHIVRYKEFNHKFIFNIAADLVVNQYIESYQLIEGAILLDTFPELNLEPHQHVEEYYNLLMELQNKFGSGENEEEAKCNQAWQNLKSLLDQNNENQKRHQLWKRLDELTSAERELLENAMKQGLENALKRTKSKDFGNLPANLQDYLRSFEQSLVPIANWKMILRLFANSSSRTRIKNTLRRPSKRYGTTPGIKVKKKQKILIAIDTSGSIAMDELTEFFNEIYHIWKQGSEVFVVECDTEIHQSYFYKGISPQTVSGGGGTAFEAPILYANEQYKPDAIIYFTDGYGGNPNVKSFAPLLWLVSHGGTELESMAEFQGRKIKMV